MKALGIILIIPIVLAIEAVLSICTFTLYIFASIEYGGFLTKRLIDKL